MVNQLLFGPYDEFHVFNRFNCLFPRFKSADVKKMIAVVPYNAACIVNNADEIICMTNEQLSKTNSNYPDVLERMGPMERYDAGYEISGFMHKADCFANRHYKDLPLRKIIYTSDPDFIKRSYLPTPYILYKGDEYIKRGQNRANLFDWIVSDFRTIITSIKNGYSILPFLKDKNVIENKFKNMFVDNNTVIVLTRNFKKKQPESYNSTEITKSYICNFLKLGYSVVNIGFPAMHYDITGLNTNKYHEINCSFTYSEFLCFCYMAKLLVMKSDSCSYSTHVCSQLDILTYGDEWTDQFDGVEKKMFFNARKSRTDLYTEDISDINQLELILKNYNNKNFRKYTDSEIIHILD